MPDDRFAAVEALYHAACGRPAADRAAFLAEACAGDEDLAREVESLLATRDGVLGFLSDESGPAVLPGETVGRYRIEQQIGVGGMGVVYKAVDLDLGRPVALKAFADRWLGDAGGAARLRAEAQAAASLDHPYICKVFELVDARSRTFIVMEYVDGETLHARLRRGALPIGEVLRLGREIAEGLANAHARGLVHRDVKPSNVMITSHGHVKLLDFGLARADAQLPPEGTTRIGQLAEGGLAGTPAYMAPEQKAGQPTTARTDVYALGLVLQECLTGERAIGPASPSASTEAPRTGRRHQRPAAPVDLLALIDRCQAVNPIDRPASADEVAAELARIQNVEATRQSVLNEEVARRRARRWFAGFAALALLTAVFVGMLIVRALNSVRPHEVVRAAQVTQWPGDESDSRLSPNGLWLSFLSDRDGAPRLFVQSTNGGEARSIDLPAGRLMSHVWSPDSERIACFVLIESRMFVQVLSHNGGSVLTSVPVVPRPSSARAVRWIGSAVYFSAEAAKVPYALYRLDLDSGMRTTVTERWPEARYLEFDVRPDGAGVVFSIGTGEDEQANLWISALDGGRREQITNDTSTKRGPRWIGNSDAVIYQSNRDGRAALWEVSTRPRHDTWPVSSEAPAQPQSSSLDGSLISYRVSMAEAGLIRIDRAQEQPPISPEEWADVAPSLSADGRVLAFQRADPKANDAPNSYGWRMQTMVLDAGGPPRPPVDRGSGVDPIVSPDGRWVAFLGTGSLESRSAPLIILNVATAEPITVSSVVRLPTHSAGPFYRWQTNYVWDRGSKDLYFIDGDDRRQLRAYDVTARRVRDPAIAEISERDQITDVLASADEAKLAYVVTAESSHQLHVRDLGSGHETLHEVDRRGWPLLRGWTRDGALIVVFEPGVLNPDTTKDATILRIDSQGRTRNAGTLNRTKAGSARLDAARGEIIFDRLESGIHRVWARSIATGALRVIRDNALPSVAFGSIASDGRGGVIVSREVSKRDIWLLWFKHQ